MVNNKNKAHDQETDLPYFYLIHVANTALVNILQINTNRSVTRTLAF